MPYVPRRCPDCGANLDAEENCDCMVPTFAAIAPLYAAHGQGDPGASYLVGMLAGMQAAGIPFENALRSVGRAARALTTG